MKISKSINPKTKISKVRQMISKKVNPARHKRDFVLQDMKDNLARNAELMTSSDYIRARSYLASLEMESYKHLI